ncbi:hypothetical protein [Polaromonas sp. P5_D5]
MGTGGKDQPKKAPITDNIRSMSVHRGLCVFYGLFGVALFVLLWDGVDGESIIGPGLLVLAFGTVHGVIAFGAARSRPWARTSSIVVACLLLLGVPIGTLIGVYLLANLKWPKAGDV